MKTCIATMISLNIAIKAQKALAYEGIYVKIVSLDPSATRRGCAYGIEFSCSQERDVKAILRKERINPSQYINEARGNPL